MEVHAMTIIKARRQVFFLTLLLLLCAGCEDIVDAPPPEEIIQDPVIIQDPTPRPLSIAMGRTGFRFDVDLHGWIENGCGNKPGEC